MRLGSESKGCQGVLRFVATSRAGEYMCLDPGGKGIESSEGVKICQGWWGDRSAIKVAVLNDTSSAVG